MMKRNQGFGLVVSLGLIVLGMIAFAANPAGAATAAGPYYAMPSWDQTMPASTRFIVLSNFNNEAVLDRETGLVWEQSPSTSLPDWVNASIHCLRLNKGGRQSWRLPTIQDLQSLIDPTQSNPALPSGHPFTNVQSSDYWSATTLASASTFAWAVLFNNGGVGDDNKSAETHFAWCVRGGQGVDAQ
jgi:hypothetical protein